MKEVYDKLEVMLIKSKVDYFGNTVLYVFEDSDGVLYCWRSGSDKAFDELPITRARKQKVIITSYKKVGGWTKDDGTKVVNIANVRYKVVD